MKKKLSASILQFIQQQETIPIHAAEKTFPYSDYVWKAVTCILLSGRIRPKSVDGLPNMTDTNRFCKEANFNQYYLFSMASFLLAGGVIEHHMDSYKKGKEFNAFWGDSLTKMQGVAQEAVLTLIDHYSPFQSWRPTLAIQSGLIEFMRVFFGLFSGQALRYDQIGKLFLSFSKLPESELTALAKELGIRSRDLSVHEWEQWLAPKGQAAMIRSLFDGGWAYVYQKQEVDWFSLTWTGRVMLGLDPSQPRPPKVQDFRVLPNLCIFAGADLSMEKLALLFRYCRVKKIDRIIEFQLDRKAMNEMPSRTSAGRELYDLLKEFEPLPSGFRNILEEKPAIGGALHIKVCSAIVKMEDPEMLSVIRKHNKLKGYIEPGGPPGFLLVKSTSNPANFVMRCREYGFEVKPF